MKGMHEYFMVNYTFDNDESLTPLLFWLWISF